MTIEAPPITEPERLFALGMGKLDAGDLIGASWNLWQAAEKAMTTYSDARGWKPENRRYYEDIAAFRREEMGVSMRDDPLHFGFVSAIMLAENVIEEGQLMSELMIRDSAIAVETLIQGYLVGE